MGTFHVRIEVGNPANGEFHWVEPLVDTGATFSMLPESFLTETLGLSPTGSQRFRLADGGMRDYGIGEARFRIADQERTSPIVFGPEGRYLLGATSLQTFALIADTSHHRLIPAPELTL
jgi:predicted aspartyl protease